MNGFSISFNFNARIDLNLVGSSVEKSIYLVFIFFSNCNIFYMDRIVINYNEVMDVSCPISNKTPIIWKAQYFNLHFAI